jgi:hypothetical protein
MTPQSLLLISLVPAFPSTLGLRPGLLESREERKANLAYSNLLQSSVWCQGCFDSVGLSINKHVETDNREC